MNRLFTSSRVLHSQGGSACLYPAYPAPLSARTHDTLAAHWWFETLPQSGLSGGSKYKAYIRARCFASRAAAYLGQYYQMLAGPKGFLP